MQCQLKSTGLDFEKDFLKNKDIVYQEIFAQVNFYDFIRQILYNEINNIYNFDSGILSVN